MTITRIAVGDGEVPDGTNPATLAGLVHEVERSRATCTAPIVEADTLSLEIEYRNKWDEGTFGEGYTDQNGLTESFWLKEYAIFALDANGNEIMLYYANLGEFPEPVAKWNGRNLVSKRYPVSISIVDDDADVQLAFPANAFITSEYLESRLSVEGSKYLTPRDMTEHDLAPAAHGHLSEKFFRQAMSGNIKNYIDWAKEYPQIGCVRVQPLWFGVNTVRVLITDDEGMTASKELTDCFQFYLDPNSSGVGNGVAPIGAHVTVASGIACLLSISVSLELADGYTHAVGLEKALEHYIEEHSSTLGIVDYSEIHNIMLNLPSIKNAENLQLNGGMESITLSDDEIPFICEITMEVV